ncbi:DUF1302 domain-containing protein [Algiphilus sp.]|uniref:DUF1302 domain-containing protein n=1 Tax=Algiphilus sp. TaxID=1872431 RepID=UPI003B5236C0
MAVFAACLALGTTQGQAADFRLGEVDIRINQRAAVGASWRLEDRNNALLAKLNVPGQERLCVEDDCMSLMGDPAPNQRLVDARGGYNVNGDDGNLNYAQGDIVYATAQYQPEISVFWGELSAKFTGLAYYDPFNSDFLTFNENTLFQPERVPRRPDLEADLGRQARLLEAFVSAPVPGFDGRLRLSVGQQILRWGESTFLVFSSLNQINPLSARLLRQPGARLKNAFLPVGMIIADYEFSANVSVNAFYQYDWAPTEPDVAGSFLSTADIGAAGDGPTNLTIGIGQFPEDPNRQFQPSGLSSLLSSATRTAYLLDERFGEPRDEGQFGLRLNYYAEWLNGGSELSFYGMNYHSRLPYLSVFAAERSCLRDREQIAAGDLGAVLPLLLDALPDLGGALDPVTQQTAFAQALLACGGFAGDANIINDTVLDTIAAQIPGVPEVGQEALPVDTIRPFLDYPEDIQLYGFSGTTNIGAWSFAGEIAYSPNQPVQVATRDVLFASLQPAFPDEDVGIPTGAESIFTVPGARSAAPDFLQTRFRRDPVSAGERVTGYERLSIGQASFTAIRALSASNWIGADQILVAVEVGATQIFDLPALERLQIEGSGATNTHFSPGADGSGSGGEPDTRRVNPEQADPDIFADDFAWGYRILLLPTYHNAVFGMTVIPRALFEHDVQGTSAFPIQNFVEGQIKLTAGFQMRLTRNLTTTVDYTMFTGAGDRNLRSDRDHITASLAYAF